MKSGGGWEEASLLIALELSWRKQNFRSGTLILALRGPSQATGLVGEGIEAGGRGKGGK